MDIGEYFSSSKKRDFSDNSKEDGDILKKSKKQHEAAVTAITMFLKKVWFIQTVEVFSLIT